MVSEIGQGEFARGDTRGLGAFLFDVKEAKSDPKIGLNFLFGGSAGPVERRGTESIQQATEPQSPRGLFLSRRRSQAGQGRHKAVAARLCGQRVD
jgi:hypothetical protein